MPDYRAHFRSVRDEVSPEEWRARVELAACYRLVALYGIGQSLLSHHMRKLVDAGLVSVERRHKWAYYSISPQALKELTAWLS